MDLFITFSSYILLLICLFGILGLFIRVFTIIFKK